jgi:hypothetical protein
MTSNESFKLSFEIKNLLQTDLLHAFEKAVPVDLIEQKAREANPAFRDCVYTPCNTVLIMLLSAIQEDKSLQNSLNIFKNVFEQRCGEVIQSEAEKLRQEQSADIQTVRKRGRPKKYQSRLRKCYLQPLSASTAGLSNARKKLDKNIVEAVYRHSTDFGDFDSESWYGMKTFITDGAYIQLQDTEDIKSQYQVKGMESSYPQALLQVMIRQGSGQVSQFSMGSRQESELALVISMIRNLEKNSLLLADDLYNTYYHFCLTLSQGCHIIVPGKRDRNYRVIRNIHDNDQIVEISKTTRPDYIDAQEWENLPDKILMRRITYTYPTKNGVEPAVLYTTILDKKISSADIIAKYAMRWDIEISIREIKTIMDINVLRSKSIDMMVKELFIALTAYNMVRKIIAKSAGKAGFPPQEDIFQECSPFNRSILLDKKGRVFFKWSPGRYGYASGANKQKYNTTSKRKKKTFPQKNETWKV